jgi:hypothetical protein
MLAQASCAASSLQRGGHIGAAAEVLRTANCLQFEALDNRAPIGGVEGEAQREKAVLVRLVVQGDVKLTKAVPFSLFKLYDRTAEGLSGTGMDATQAANAAAARCVFAEFHVARLNGTLDSATEAVLAGESLLPGVVEEASARPAMWIALGALAFIAFWFSLWQCLRTFNFIDGTYLMENLNLFSQGLMPYRDFYLVLPPMHYWIHGLAFKLADGSAFWVFCSGAVVQSLTVLVAFWVCQGIHRAPLANLFFVLIPAVSGVATLGQPIYDCDAVLAVVLAIGALLRAERASGLAAWIWALVAGIAAGVSCLIKYNIGAPLLVSLVVALVAGLFLFVRFPWAAALGFLLGVGVSLGAFTYWIVSNDAIGPLVEQTILFPSKVRLHPFTFLISSLPLLRHYNYINFFWALFLGGLWVLIAFGWFAGTHRRPVLMMLPVVLMAVCLGTMQSQAFGSVYGLGAIAAVALAVAHRAGTRLFGSRVTVIVAAFALLFAAASALSSVRQSRLGFMGEMLTDPAPFSEKLLQGVKGHRPAVRSFEAAVSWAKKNVRPGESVFWWPGTAPFYLVTGLPCPLANFQVFGPTGLTPAQALEQLENRRVVWVFVDRSCASIDSFGSFSMIESRFYQRYAVAGQAEAVTIYRRREAP